MALLSVLFWRLRALLSQRAAEEETDEELRCHIALLEERYIGQGMPAREVRAAARRQFGGVTQLKEELRERRTILLFETIFHDVRYALRKLRKAPVFSLTAVSTLALAIGVNTAIFSVVYAVLIRPLPFRNVEELAIAWEQDLPRGWSHNIVSAANFVDWRRLNHVFSDMALVDPFLSFNLTGGGEPVEVKAERVTPNLFAVLGIEPLLGRSFVLEEGRPGGARVVILGHALWQRQYAGDRSIVGKKISLNGEDYTVIGVMPAGFSAVYSRSQASNAQIWAAGLDLSDPGRVDHNYIAIARLRPGVTLDKAQADMNTITAGLEKQYPDNRGWSVGLVSLHDEVVGDTRPALLVLLGAVGVILLIACVNLANLFLARGAAHMREVAVRKALGASRRRLLLQMLTETLVLTLLGAVAGLWIAHLGVRGLIAIAPVDTPGIEEAGLQNAVLLYTAGIGLVTAIAFGLAPALRLSLLNVSDSLKESGRGSTGDARSGKLRQALVSAEFALALALTASAGLMVKTLWYMHRIDYGFRPDHVLTLSVPLNTVGNGEQQPFKTGDRGTEAQQAEFFHRLLIRLRAVPGIENATVSRGLPVFGWSGQGYVTPENPNPPFAEMPDGNFLAVGPEYFRVLRIPLIKGRVFTEQDTDGAPLVAVVNEALARAQWPGQNPIGKKIRVFWDKSPWRTVVGVTGNVRTRGPGVDFGPEIYAPYRQHPWLLAPRDLMIRTLAADPLAVVPSVRQAVHELDAQQPISDVRTMDAVVSQPLGIRNFLTCLLGGFALLALLLAAIGVYGVMSYSVAQRFREMGIRIALGASQGQVLSIVVRDGFRMALLGIAVGSMLALGAARLLSSQLYRVKAADPETLIAVTLMLAAVAALAAYLPARRAARVDPIMVLRDE
jgi:putative ABC transport system permease protein